MSEKQPIYSNGVIEFVTVCAETIRFLTSSEEYTKKDLVDRALKLLPLVYLKVTLLPETDRVLEEEELRTSSVKRSMSTCVRRSRLG